MNHLLFLPLLIPLATAVVCLALWRRPDLQRIVSLVGASTLLLAGWVLLTAVRHQGVLSVQAGAWSAPFGITLVADLLSAVMVCVTGVMGLAVAI